jgi:hypothetical protein
MAALVSIARRHFFGHRTAWLLADGISTLSMPGAAPPSLDTSSLVARWRKFAPDDQA